MNPNTIQSRIDNSKQAVSILPKTEESNMIERAVELFEAKGGVIFKPDQGVTSYRSANQKKHDEDARRKAGNWTFTRARKCAK